MSKHTCDTLVVTQTDASVHVPGQIERVLRKLDDGRFQFARYDLLTIPPLPMSLNEIERRLQLDQIREDVVMAIKHHGTKRVVVLATERNLDGLHSQIKTALSELEVEVQKCTLPELRILPSTELVITCMDWRQHAEAGGLQAKLNKTFGSVDRCILTSAGGAKEIRNWSLRADAVLLQTIHTRARHRSINRIILTVHTDCGMYGGNKAFKQRFPNKKDAHKWQKEQFDTLRLDLLAATNTTRLTRLCAVELAVIEVNNERITTVVRVSK